VRPLSNLLVPTAGAPADALAVPLDEADIIITAATGPRVPRALALDEYQIRESPNSI
jgi:hypothetical protein